MCSVTDMDLGEASTTELVNALAAIASELAARTAPESAAECMELAETLAAASDVQESALVGFIARVDESGEMRRWGFPSAQAWLRSRLGMRDQRARERITLARHLHRLPAVTELLARGELSYGYATTVADAVARLDDDDCAKAEILLLDMVGQGFSPGKVAAFGRRIREVIIERDGHDQAPHDAQRGYERSWITTTRSLDGGRYINGWLNPEDTAIWDGTLAPLAKPTGPAGPAGPAGLDDPRDPRDLPERTAAALTAVLSGGHKATKVTLICDLDTLTGSHTPARLTDGTPIPAPQARRIALSAGVSPLLLAGGHTPLYLGHKVRFATAAQRQVLETLYPTCAVQGCEVPGTLCEVDHINGWALGNSPTDIDKLALCCGWHNRYKHTKPHQIHITHNPTTGRFTYRLLPPPHTRTTDPPTASPQTVDPRTVDPRTAGTEMAGPGTANSPMVDSLTTAPPTTAPPASDPPTGDRRAVVSRAGDPRTVESREGDPRTVGPAVAVSRAGDPRTVVSPAGGPPAGGPPAGDPQIVESHVVETRAGDPPTVVPGGGGVSTTLKSAA
ncbi:DUF222 domain-containing protein [Actinomadura luteofluorescens]